MTVREWCPVGELAGNRHRYVAGDGVVIPWDVAGDPRSGVEACRECGDQSRIDAACSNCGNKWGEMIKDRNLIYCRECWGEYDNAHRCESCGVTGGGVEGGLCEACFASIVRRMEARRRVADRSDEIDAYLRVHDYDSVEAWAADSDYERHGDEWRDEHGNTVDIHECLIGVLDEQLRAHE